MTFADHMYIMKHQRKKERKEMSGIQKSTNVNSFIGGLPRIAAKKIWKVTDANGTVVQYVSGANNLKRNAQLYIDNKYPGQKMTLTFSHTKDFIVVTR